ncbi:hypothetical protein AGMMS49949_03840 [Alphaproteobacteria bacterium]|nr:hypothetical protein AGMMS49949_03840 [Alphaproteobacteria bacterium]GHS96056.1 hypothetical protein AGMMS50296_1790 [Alphaproteobacteria bacterium]
MCLYGCSVPSKGTVYRELCRRNFYQLLRKCLENNSNTRHYLGRRARRTKIVSKTEEMVHVTMKLGGGIAEYEGWKFLTEVVLSIF